MWMAVITRWVRQAGCWIITSRNNGRLMTEQRQNSTQIAIAVVEQDGRFLVGRRPAGVPLAGLSEFPGGKIEPQETAEAAAVRECFEETGIVVEVTGRYPAH